ncbi:unnamed protein product [Camellia sinensis]
MVFASFWYSGIFRRLFCTDNLPTSPSDLITGPTTTIPTTTTFENPKKDFKTQVKTPGLVARFMGLGSFPNPRKVFRRKEDQKGKGGVKNSRNNKKVQQAVRVFDLLHHSLSPHHESTSENEQPMSAYLVFTTEAMMRKEKDLLKPKQPISAFFMFRNERRAALLAENKTVYEVAKITGEEWNNMTKKQKKPYEKIAKKNKEKYLEEMEAYKQRNEEESANLKKEEDELMKNSQARSLAIAQEEREN